MNRRHALTTLAAALAGCGGGGATARPVVGVYGDSLASGDIAVPPWRLAVPPARRLQELLGDRALVADYAQAGARVADALAGAATMPLGPFPAHLQAAAPDLVVLRFGGADALLGTPAAAFAADLAELVRLARGQGRVLVVGLPRHPAHDARLQALDAAAAAVAQAAGVRFVSLQQLPAARTADGTHPDQASSDQHTAAIGAALGQML